MNSKSYTHECRYCGNEFETQEVGYYSYTCPTCRPEQRQRQEAARQHIQGLKTEKKPLDHSDYECWPGGPLNFSKWSRENEPKPPHRFKVGDVVKLTVVAEVLELTHDCDGSPLYTLEMVGHGWGEENLELVKEEKKKETQSE